MGTSPQRTLALFNQSNGGKPTGCLVEQLGDANGQLRPAKLAVKTARAHELSAPRVRTLTLLLLWRQTTVCNKRKVPNYKCKTPNNGGSAFLKLHLEN